ncbi:hypothetical protein G9A89_002725 [Geosiphon pyriformis]|nr:hypothetical protein G9A89_002725 [Geosiphon pyriformis]
MSSKKAAKGVFYSPAGGSFSQRKKASLENVKHSGDEKNISLKFGSGASVYSDVESLSGNDENVSMSGGFDGSLLNLAVNTPKAKQVNTSANFGSSIGFSDFEIDEKVKLLPPPLKKKRNWLRKKLSSSEKFFQKSMVLGGTTIPSKFEEIIKSTFTSEENMKKAVLLAGENGISINNDLRKQGFRSDQAIVIKEIPMDMLRDMIVAIVSEFEQIKSIKIQLIGMWQKTVVEFAESNQANLLASK